MHPVASITGSGCGTRPPVRLLCHLANIAFRAGSQLAFDARRESFPSARGAPIPEAEVSRAVGCAGEGITVKNSRKVFEWYASLPAKDSHRFAGLVVRRARLHHLPPIPFVTGARPVNSNA